MFFMPQTPARDSVSLKFCKPCVRCHPAVKTMSLSLNVAAMQAEVGATSVRFAHCQVQLSIRSSAHMDQDTQLMAGVGIHLYVY